MVLELAYNSFIGKKGIAQNRGKFKEKKQIITLKTQKNKKGTGLPAR